MCQSNLVRWLDLNALFPHAHDRAALFALLAAFFRFAFVGIDNGNSREFVRPTVGALDLVH